MADLPAVPEGQELEDYVAALLQCTGFFVEKNIQEHNVYELDILATRYSQEATATHLFEVKGTEPRFTDIFKLYGWMNYLEIDNGAYVIRRPPQDRDPAFFEQRCAEMGIMLLMVDDLSDAPLVFEQAGFGLADPLPHTVWRFSFWLERLLIASLREKAGADVASLGSREALRYYQLINNGIFHARDPLERVAQLYDAFQGHPRLTLSFAKELDRGDFDPDVEVSDSDSLRNALFQGRHVELHASMYLEHRARLALLRAAADYLVSLDRAGKHLPRIGRSIRLGALPGSFVDGLRWLEQQDEYWLCPVLWQSFLWSLGGLIIDGREQETHAYLARSAGLSDVSTVAVALQAFDRLFPHETGWFRRMPTADYEFVVMMPWPMQGIGAFHQLSLSGHTKYQDLAPSGEYTASDLAARHNAAVALLEGRA